MMRKTVHFLTFLLVATGLFVGVEANAQGRIELRRYGQNGVTLQSSSMNGFTTTISFSSIESELVESDKGEFSEIHIEGSYPNGNVGEPELPMFTRLIAIPDGATPHVSVGEHSETVYALNDYGIGRVAAKQAPVRKDNEPSAVEYSFSEEAYARDSYNDDPIAMVEVLGTMRGITLGRLIVQPVRYNPVAGTVKVFNDLEVNVDFENGDAEGTAQMFSNTYSPAFSSVYDQILNIDMLMGGHNRDAYTDHPDMYNTPVRMLVICYSGFKNNAALNSWLEWKLQKGYYVDIYYTDETGTTANNIKSFIQTKYNASVSSGNAYTYLIVIGDTGQVPQYMTKTIDYACASDLGYSAVNFTTSSTTNYFPDMYYSRMSVENATHLTNYINKVLTYEKYEFTDGGNYLNNVILVGGYDSYWTNQVAKPTINYGKNNYFNSNNTTYGGFGSGTISAIVSTSSTQGYSGTNNGCYNGINNGTCIVNYTAHGDRQEWSQPNFTAAQVATLTNTGKYFFGIGNCCLTGNFNNTTTTYSPGTAIGANACFAETMIRVPNAGAVAYIGSSPYSYWYEDFYWAVGAHSFSGGNAPSVSNSSKGVYDVMFDDQYWNSASALLYVGNLAVQQAVTNGNTNSSITDGNCRNSAHYYFQFYHTFGDGSVMPYITKPEANNVTIPASIEPRSTSMTVNAVAGSYVAVTDNSSVIYGVGVANASGVATVNFTESIPNSGTLYVVVTRQQYQPYFGTTEIVSSSNIEVTATATPSIIALGSSSTLRATATGGSNYSYSWSPAATLNNANIQQPTATPITTTEYTVTVTSGNDSNTASVTVTVVTPPTNLTLAAVDCNTGIRLTWAAADLATSYKVYRGNNLIATVTGTTYTDSNLGAGTYSYRVGAVYEGVEARCAVVSKTLDGGSTITNTVDVTECDSYTWNGVTYTNSGVHTATFQTTSGCDSIVTLNLMINHSVTNEFSVTSEEPYVWNGLAYNHTGDYTQTFDAANGCDSVVTMHLTYTGITGNCYHLVTPSAAGDFILGYLDGSTLIMPTNAGGNTTAMTTATITATATDYGFSADEDNTPVMVTLTATGTAGQYYISYNGLRMQRASGPGARAVVWTTGNSTSRTAWTIDGTSIKQSNYYLYYNNGFYTSSTGTTNVAFYSEGDCPVPCASVTHEFDATACDSYTWNDVAYTESGDYVQTFEIGGGGGDEEEGVIFFYDFDNTPEDYTGWQIMTADDDTLYWGIYSQDGYGHNSSDFLASFSYYDGTDLTPDNLVILPFADISSNTKLSFWARQLTNGWEDVLGVYVTTTEDITSTADFEQVDSDLTISSDTWTQYTFDLGAYAGQSVGIAFRHYNCTGQHAVLVDDIELYNGSRRSTAANYSNVSNDDRGERDLQMVASNGISQGSHIASVFGHADIAKAPVREICDSIVTLHLTIFNSETEDFTVTECDTYTWHGQPYTESGTYVFDTTTAQGCTRTETLYLTINNSETEEFTVSECDTYTWHGEPYTESGTYVFNTTTAQGCERVETLHLTINNSETEDFTVTECDTYTWHGEPYTESGTYVFNTTTVQGCERVETLYLTINNSEAEDFAVTECDTYTWHGEPYTESGTYVFDTTTAQGCARTETLYLTINNSETEDFTVTECDTYTWHGEPYTESGTYVFNTTTTQGCERVETLYLTINNSETEDFTVTECDTYTWHGEPYTESGTYTYTTTTAQGCERIETLYLTINNSETEEYTVAECENYTWHGEVYTESGTYTFTTTTAQGCERIETLNLTIYSEEVPPVSVTECDQYTWNGETYTESGTYEYDKITPQGCEVHEILYLTINYSETEDFTVTECDTYTWHGEPYTESGTYTYTTTTAQGCTRTETLYLTINNSEAEDYTITECDTYTWHGEPYTESGTYVFNTTTAQGCERVETLYLTINNSETEDFTVTECDTYTWHGEPYTESGTYVFNTTTTQGCERVETLYLTINNSEAEDFTVTECDTYTWHGQPYTESGTYTYTTTTAQGCERVETLYLTINNSETEDFIVTECDTYTWHGEPYTESGTYTYTATTAQGCEHIETLYLTINNSETEDFTVTECDKYIWHGEPYTESGTYTYTTTTAQGCERIETLYLTINYSETEDFTVTECDTYTWHGQPYTESGTYTYTTTTLQGCDRIETLYLTINNSETQDYTVTECDTYTWHGQLYTESGTYVFNTTTSQGCERVETLYLTINNSETEDFTVTECDTYTWHGQPYTESGTYVFNTTTAQGCERVETLYLTINNSETEDFTVTECDTYTWHGEPYTESGTYVFNTTTAQGCEHIETLYLTINNSETEDFTVTECDKYIWHGEPYTESGTYTYTTTTAQGCERIETLYLTINYSETEDYTVTECDTYTWHGQPYTESGTYTFTTTTTQGCERIETLYLTINNSETEDFIVTECDTYTWHGESYTESGTYVFNTTTAQGCERVETLYLTINETLEADYFVTVCDNELPFVWHGTEYYTMGDYPVVIEGATEQGCDSIVTLKLSISEAPVIEVTGDTLITFGEETTLTASGADTYVWSTGATTSSITVSPTDQATTYTVVGTNADGCSTTAEIAVYTIDGVGANSFSISVYPNPTRNVVRVEAEGIRNIRLVDMLGQTMYDSNESGDSVQIDMSGYAAGVYFMEVKTVNGIATQKVVRK